MVLFVYQCYGMDGHQRRGFGSQPTVAQGDGKIAILQGQGDFSRGKVSLGTDQHSYIEPGLNPIFHQDFISSGFAVGNQF